MDSSGELIYRIILRPGWNEFYSKMNPPDQEAIMKKIEKQKFESTARHLKKGTEFSVLEIGKNRVTLIINEKEKTKEVYFIGNHKQYEKWYTRNIGFHDEAFEIVLFVET